jgi:hypothetical protein
VAVLGCVQVAAHPTQSVNDHRSVALALPARGIAYRIDPTRKILFEPQTLAQSTINKNT